MPARLREPVWYCGFRTPISGLLVAGVHGLRPDAEYHVEVEAADAIDILRGIHGANARINADLLQACHIGKNRPLHGRAVEHISKLIC